MSAWSVVVCLVSSNRLEGRSVEAIEERFMERRGREGVKEGGRGGGQRGRGW